jgi:ABC-type transport system involved in cytochrome c biogenesis ATPase subunit
MTKDAIKVKLTHMVKKEGLLRTAQKLGIGKEAVLRYLAGMKMREGSRVLIEQRVSGKAA